MYGSVWNDTLLIELVKGIRGRKEVREKSVDNKSKFQSSKSKHLIHYVLDFEL